MHLLLYPHGEDGVKKIKITNGQILLMWMLKRKQNKYKHTEKIAIKPANPRVRR